MPIVKQLPKDAETVALIELATPYGTKVLLSHHRAVGGRPQDYYVRHAITPDNRQWRTVLLWTRPPKELAEEMYVDRDLLISTGAAVVYDSASGTETEVR